jgi:hypothetical protein
MDYRTFYSKLFRPLAKAVGPIDRDTIVALIGFDFGGPLNFCTIGAKKKNPVVTYVSCELAVRKEQVPSSRGRFELMCHCDDEKLGSKGSLEDWRDVPGSAVRSFAHDRYVACR